jgi:hypothetical protein
MGMQKKRVALKTSLGKPPFLAAHIIEMPSAELQWRPAHFVLQAKVASLVLGG